MRKAIQYSKSLADLVSIFKDGNNGGYANTWLCGDTKTNEIGKLELGLKHVIWNHKTDGFFIGSNFPEDPALIADEVPGGWDANPNSNGCEDRRARWNELLTQNRGKVNANLAKSFLADTFDQAHHMTGASDCTLCGRMDAGMAGAVNTKVVDSAMASKMSFCGKMGFSDGSTLSAPEFFKTFPRYSKYTPFLKSIPNQPWTTFPLKD
jgi:hypothetical protein